MLISDLDDIIGHSKYTAYYLSPKNSLNILIKICINKSWYILKVFKNINCFEKEVDFMYLLNKNLCKAPRLARYGSTNSKSWVLYEYVDGVGLDEKKSQLSLNNLKQIWKQVGKGLRRIHSIPLQCETKKKENLDRFVNQIERIVLSFNNYLDHNDTSLFLVRGIQFLKNNFHCIYKKENYGIVHYDLADRHIIIKQRNEKWIFQAFIDFEYTCFGCIYVDIAKLYIYALLDDNELEKNFWSGYMKKEMSFDKKCLCFFIIFFVLRNINFHNQYGFSIIDKTLERSRKFSFGN